MRPTVESGSKSEITVKNNILHACGKYKEAVVTACGALVTDRGRLGGEVGRICDRKLRDGSSSVKNFNGEGLA